MRKAIFEVGPDIARTLYLTVYLPFRFDAAAVLPLVAIEECIVLLQSLLLDNF